MQKCSKDRKVASKGILERLREILASGDQRAKQKQVVYAS